jgi:uncharacterized protein (DUF924 family)
MAADARIDEVLAFWFAAPAEDSPGLMGKYRRWFAGGAAMDEAIGSRFGDLVEEALAGGLRGWEDHPRGLLAKVLLLDQFVRNLHRGTPRAYAGDEDARRLALAAVSRGWIDGLSVEESLFVGMPLAHAEDVELQRLSLELTGDLVRRAPPPLREALERGRGRGRYYLGIIERFGRFPHRNGILGRASTPEELAFLAEPDPGV